MKPLFLCNTPAHTMTPQTGANLTNTIPSDICYERRNHERIDVRINANAYCRGRFQTVAIRNVSRGGLLMCNGFGFCVGNQVAIKTIKGHAYTGRIAWAVPPFAGLAFDTRIAADDPIFKPGFRIATSKPHEEDDVTDGGWGW